MSIRRASRALFLFSVFAAAAVRGQEPADEPIPNWPAPSTWSPPRAHGLTTQGDISSPLPFIAATPCRQYDSRNATALPNNTNRSVTLTGAPCNIPGTAAAVSVNITVFSITGAGGNGVFQVGTANDPTFAWINYPPTETQRGNAGVVPLSGGQIVVKVNQGGGSLHFTVDVNGYYAAAGVGGLNTFLGSSAGNSTMSGDANVAIGALAFLLNSTGGSNTAVGVLALLVNTDGSSNTGVGFSALSSNQVSSFNTALGYEALGTASAGSNTAVGANALLNVSSGTNNIGIGASAGVNQTTGSHDIYIGNPGVNGESNTIRIGNASFQDGGTIITGISGLSSIGGAPVYVNGGGRMGTSTASSRRFKQDIRDVAEKSDALMRLRPVAFRYLPEHDPTGVAQYGLIAEEVAEVYPDLITSDRDGRPEGVRYHVIPTLLLNEVQKQRRTIQDQQVEILDLKARLAALEARVPAEPQP